MSNLTRIPPDLLSMPNEILTEICSHAHDDDDTESRGKEWLRAARLTCKQLNVPATVEFGKKFFANPQVQINNYSLQALVDICAHKVLGPYVRGVALRAYRLGDWECNVEGPLDNVVESLRTRDSQALGEAGNELRDYANAYGEEFHLVDSGRAEDLLTQAFTLISRFHSSVSIAVVADFKSRAIGGLKRLGEDSVDTWKDATWDYKPKATLRMLLSATQRSKTKVKEFVFHVGQNENKDKEPEDDDLDELAIEGGMFTELESVKLHFKSATMEYTRGLCEILEEAEDVTDLELTTTADLLEHDVAEDLFKSTNSMSLRRVVLGVLLCEQEDLIDLLDEQSDSLEELLLDGVVLIGSWFETLEWIQENLSLRVLTINSVRTTDPVQHGVRFDPANAPYWSGNTTWNGVNEVHLGLEQLLEEKRRDGDEHDWED